MKPKGCQSARSRSWPLRWAAFFQLEQIKKKLALGGVREEAKGLTLNTLYFPRSRVAERNVSMACGDLMRFFFC